MKKFLFLLLIPIGFGFSGTTLFSPPDFSNHLRSPFACSVDNYTFQDGEEIHYAVYYNWGVLWIPAGTVIFKVNDIGTEYHFSVVGKTYKSYEWFFKVRDYYDSWVDKETLLPNTSLRNVREGGYTLYDKNDFNRKNNTVHNIRGRTKATVKEDNHFEVEPCLHDMLSILYFTRNYDFSTFQKGDTFPIKLFVDKETWNLQVQFNGREENKEIKKMGKFNTLKFSPQVIEGNVFPGDAKLNLWVTDDENRLPLLIESPVSVGSVKAVLKHYSGLRHEVKAKVED